MPLYCIPDVYCNLPFLEISSAYEGNDKSMTPHFVEEGWSYLNSDEVPKKWFDTPSLFHAGLESTCDPIYIPKNPLFLPLHAKFFLQIQLTYLADPCH